jgi:hypothetical protein
MTETILCIVGLFFMAWVIVLKLQIDRMKGSGGRAASRNANIGRRATVKGNQSFDLD